MARSGLANRRSAAAVPYLRSTVPRISTFYGVVIYMYWNERDHPVAHFHAYHASQRVSISVYGEVLAGSLDGRALRLIREWAALRHDELSVEQWTGVLAPLNDPAYFSQVTVDAEAGTLVWPNDMDLAPEPLYEQAKAHPLIAA